MVTLKRECTSLEVANFFLKKENIWMWLILSFYIATKIRMQLFMHRASSSLLFLVWYKEGYSYFDANIFTSLYHSVCLHVCERERELTWNKHAHLISPPLSTQVPPKRQVPASHTRRSLFFSNRSETQTHTQILPFFACKLSKISMTNLTVCDIWSCFSKFKLLFYLWHIKLFFITTR